MPLETRGRKLTPSNRSKLKTPPKLADAIYTTPQYRQWRYNVIHRAGNRCQDCGVHGAKVAIYGRKLYADHIVELRDGGAPFDLSNGCARCASCHTSKTMRERAKRR